MTYRKPCVGIVGAGQLARMTIQAAIPLDVGIVVLAARSDDGAAQVAAGVLVGSPDRFDHLESLAARCDVITFDHELVQPELLAKLELAGHRVWPSSSSMALAQDKWRQRSELGAIGMPVPAFARIESVEDAKRFGAEHNWPVVLKAIRGGYDGRGVWVVANDAEAAQACADASQHGLNLMAEQFLELEREFAILLARNPSGEIAIYSPIETVQVDGMCRELRVPAAIPDALAQEATTLARQIAEEIGIVGILAIEFFVSGGRLFVNELAPRPHNSGHWTIEGASTSQFEQHLRAVLDLPLGAVDPTGTGVATINIVGVAGSPDPRSRLRMGLRHPGVHVHLYGKEPRPARKVGHVTVVGNNVDLASQRANAAVADLLREDGNE